MPQESGEKAPKRQAGIKLFAAGTGVVVEWLSGLAGADDVTKSGIGAAFTVGAEAVLASRLSRRERQNAETVLLRAAERILERCADGEPLREDSFVDSSAASFVELVEGALVTAQRIYESKKLNYLGNLTASFSFEPTIDGTAANWCIRAAESLSWTQYVLLALVNEDESRRSRIPISTGRDREVDDPTTVSAWEDWEELHARRLVGIDPDETHRTEGSIPHRMTYIPTHGGRLLIRLMELDAVPAGDRDFIYDALLKGVAKPR
jgi:hypothetical protein